MNNEWRIKPIGGHLFEVNEFDNICQGQSHQG